jgi:hypothetical protein
MWFVFQGLIIFGVFCWIGQHVDYVAEPDMKRAAGGIGYIVAFGVTYAVAYAIDLYRAAIWRLKQPR